MSEEMSFEQSLDSALSDAFDKITAGESALNEPESTPAETEHAEAAPVTESEAAPAEEAVPIEETAPTAPAREAPATWRADAKAEWANIPPRVQEEILKREADAMRGFQANAEKAKGYDEFAKVIEPYRQMISAEGGTPASAVASLMQTAAVLRVGTPEQKAALVHDLCQRFGVRLDGTAPTPVDQNVAQLNQHIARLEGRLSQYETLQSQSVSDAANQQIEEFKSSTDASGAALYPHFNAVQYQMGMLIQNGEATTLKEAYAKAVEPLQAAIDAEAKKKADAIAKATAEAEKANRAKVRTKGVHPAASQSPAFKKGATFEQGIGNAMSEIYDSLNAA